MCRRPSGPVRSRHFCTFDAITTHLNCYETAREWPLRNAFQMNVLITRIKCSWVVATSAELCVSYLLHFTLRTKMKEDFSKIYSVFTLNAIELHSTERYMRYIPTNREAKCVHVFTEISLSILKHCVSTDTYNYVTRQEIYKTEEHDVMRINILMNLALDGMLHAHHGVCVWIEFYFFFAENQLSPMIYM